MHITGLSAFPITPLRDGAVDADALSARVAHLIRPGIDAVGVVGSTGLYPYLPIPERIRAVRAAVDAAGSTPVTAGIGAMTTRDAIAAAEGAARAGASALLLAPLSYLPLTEDEVFGLFADVAAATALPVVVYDNPRTTGFAISDALKARLATIPNVAAVKNPPPPDGDHAGQVACLRAAVPEGFSIGYSGDAALIPAALSGADAFHSVLAGFAPDLAVALWRLRDDPATAEGAARAYAPLRDILAGGTSIRLAYALSDRHGLPPAALPAPLRPVSDTALAAARDALDRAEAAIPG
ncbi:dihydrodipicolinate synthase family protein [Jannaschia sp. LMIT008]|uniref:dihydrodipicolinate synthase family protein n=1 Tax=Jannaschia maritima TaxID=3032585 RepID=UPI0028111B3D|nr:dihydrodipicolinate synthase family protein [Jannaschia sp. LMIT008]